MTSESPAGPRTGAGTRPLIVGVALSLTGLISIAALVVQLAAYDPSCEPLEARARSGRSPAEDVLDAFREETSPARFLARFALSRS